MNNNPSRVNRVVTWLIGINNDLDDIENVFNNNVIHRDEIGIDRYRLIISNLHEIQITIDDIISELENNKQGGIEDEII